MDSLYIHLCMTSCVCTYELPVNSPMGYELLLYAPMYSLYIHLWTPCISIYRLPVYPPMDFLYMHLWTLWICIYRLPVYPPMDSLYMHLWTPCICTYGLSEYAPMDSLYTHLWNILKNYLYAATQLILLLLFIFFSVLFVVYQ